MILPKTTYGYRVRWREGTTLRQRTCSTYEAARRLNAKMVLKRRGRPRRGPDPLDAKIAVKDFAEQWWLKRVRLAVQPKTFASYEETLRRYILKQGVGIGGLRVRDVEREDIETMLQQASAKSRSGALSRNTLRIIRAACSLLFDDATRARTPDGAHLIDANPCRGIKLRHLGVLSQQPQKPRTIRAMTHEQVSRFLSVAKRQCPYPQPTDRWLSVRDYTLFHTLTDTGLRPSEALALQWPDINIEARTLRVERAVNLGRQIKPTKTESTRTVPLTVPLAEALDRWQRMAGRHTKSDYVFPSRRTGKPLNVKRVARRFRKLLTVAELGRFKLYDLRHSYASHLLDQKVKPVDVAELMGHKNVTTTLALYSHAIPRDMGYIADKLTAARRGR